MSRSYLVSLPFVVLLVPAGQAQRPIPRSAEPPPAITLPTDAKLGISLKDIAVLIADESWPAATEQLQRLLDRKEDVFVEVKRNGSDGKPVQLLAGLHAEANRLVGSLPRAGRDFYEHQFGPKAEEELKKARKELAADPLAEVARRYFHTKAGAEAAERLAMRLLDSGAHITAALTFERLLERDGPQRLAPLTLFHAARALHLAGDRKNHDRAWQVLESKVGQAGLLVGEKRLTLAELKKEIAQRAAKQSGRRDWPTFRGDAARCASAAGSPPLSEARWKHETSTDQSTRVWLKQASETLEAMKQPALLSMHPLAFTFKHGGRSKPFVAYRDFWGVHVRTVKAASKIDPSTKAPQWRAGDLYWQAPLDRSLERLLREPRYSGTLSQWLQHYSSNRVLPGVLLENSLTGTLSTDGTNVYLIEDFQVPPWVADQRFPQPRAGGILGKAIGHNSLTACEVDSGKLVWQLGLGDGKGDADEAFFLAPPLPLDGKLHILTEKGGELRLLTIEPKRGKVLSARTLAKVHDKLPETLRRRLDAAHLAHAGGVLVCATNAGGVFGVNPLTGQTLWSHVYEVPAPQGRPLPGAPPDMVLLPDGRWIPAHLCGNNRWRYSAPSIHGGRVLLASPDSGDLHCLDLRDGSRVWRMPKRKQDLYVGGAIADVVIVVGASNCRGVRLADGKDAWTLESGTPSGLGVMAGGHFYLPQASSQRAKEPEICVIDPVRGQVFSRVRLRKLEVPGNLCFIDDVLVSQSIGGIAAYPLLANELDAIEKLLLKNPKDPAARARRGGLRLDCGDLKGAVEDVRAARAGKLEAEPLQHVEAQLYQALLQFFQRDFNAAEPYLKEFEQLSRSPAIPRGTEPILQQKLKAAQQERRMPFLIVLGRGREQQGKRVEAFQIYLELAGSTSPGLTPLPDDPALKVAPAVWARRRLDSILLAATPEERKQIEKLIEDRLK